MANPVEAVVVSRPSQTNRMARTAEVRAMSWPGTSTGTAGAAQMVGETSAGVLSPTAALQDLHAILWAPRCFS